MPDRPGRQLANSILRGAEETEVAADHEEWPSWEAVPVEVSDEEADPGQALPHEELELTETNTAAQGAVPEPKYPPKGVYKPPPPVLRPKLKAIPPEPTPVPKPSSVMEDASGGAASATPGPSSTTAEAPSSSATAPVPSPMASVATYSVRTFGHRDSESGYFDRQGDQIPHRRINREGDLEVYREDGLVEVFPNAAADQQEDEEEEPEDDDEDGQDDQPGGGNPPGGGGGPPDRDPPGDGGGASGHQGPSGGDSSDENWGSQWTQKGKVAPEPEGELGVASKKKCFARYGDGSNGQSYGDAELYYQTLGECAVCSATSAWR